MKNKNIFLTSPLAEGARRTGKSEGYIKEKSYFTPSSVCSDFVRQTTSPAKGGSQTTGGFTLIELLVVVLIIGILAAVAVPQYQKAVWKSRYATVKAMVNALADAEETYHLANGEYTTDFDALGVELPGCTNSSCQFPWGFCRRNVSATSTSYAECVLHKDGNMFIGYQRNFNFSVRNPAKAYCYDYVKAGLGPKICQSETGRSVPDEGNGPTHGYAYP